MPQPHEVLQSQTSFYVEEKQGTEGLSKSLKATQLINGGGIWVQVAQL